MRPFYDSDIIKVIDLHMFENKGIFHGEIG